MLRVAAIGLVFWISVTPVCGQSLPPGPRRPDPTVSRPTASRTDPALIPASVTPLALFADPRRVASVTDRLRLELAPRRLRGRNALIGGLIGGATGLVTCTVISNIQKDPGTGFSTCATSGYVLLGLGGAGLGALIGAIL